MRPKTRLAAELLRKRLEHADHRLRKLPGERRLAEELGLSRNTIRQALERLVREGLLTRKRNGRIAVTRTLKAQTKRGHAGLAKPARGASAGLERLTYRTIGFLAPSVFSKDHQLWYYGAIAALDGLGAKLRPLTYAHWGDPVIHQALEGMDGLFFVPHESSLPEWLIRKIREAGCRTAVLDTDESAAGLPSVVLFPPTSLQKLLKHLLKLGHRRVDCLNTQAENPVIAQRIEVWRQFLRRHELSGTLRANPIHSPVKAAYTTIRKALRDKRSAAPAQFCTTGPAAVGAMRAFHEAGLEIGSDVSVCAVNDEGLAPFLLKTLTSLASPPRDEYLRPAAEWMLSGGRWPGPLLVQPKGAPLFIGESTGPAPDDDRVLVPTRRSRHRKALRNR